MRLLFKYRPLVDKFLYVMLYLWIIIGIRAVVIHENVVCSLFMIFLFWILTRPAAREKKEHEVLDEK